MAKRVAAIQSNYIPWKGYFDIIRSVDEFILYDDVQYTPKNWRNRNRIKTPQGLKWLTIPVTTKRASESGPNMIKDMIVADQNWPQKHWAAIHANYARARYFKQFAPEIEEMYEGASSLTYLSQINLHFLSRICELLGISTRITFSFDYQLDKHGKSDRPLELALKANAGVFVTGSTALDYYVLDDWAEKGVEVEVFSYDGYPEYWQPFPPFEHGVTILDLLLNTGDRALEFMRRTLN